MGREQRKELLKQIETLRESKVLTYVTGDRVPTPAQIGDDALRPIYDHLRSMGHVPKLDLYLYSRGGAIDVPWRIITALRATADEWNVLIPFRANSAATMIALGADHIVLGSQGELGPIDPIMTIRRVVPGAPGQPVVALQDQVNVEDVMAYVRFLRDRAGLSDQEALTTGLSKLTDRLDAVVIGSAYRTHLHIRDVAHRIILSRKTPVADQIVRAIIETLAERVYAHGHAIGLKEAEALGLPVEGASPPLDKLLWDLLDDYEQELKLRSPLDPNEVAVNTDLHSEKGIIAAVESTWGVHRFEGNVTVRVRRLMPQNVNVAVNLNLNLQVPAAPGAAAAAPPSLQPLQALLAQAQPQILAEAQRAVQDALKQQAPIASIDSSFVGGRWVRED